MRAAATLTALWLCAGAAAAQDAGVRVPGPTRVETRVSAEQVALGQRFEYVLALTHPKEQLYELRPPASLGAFEQVSQARARTDAQDQATTTFTLTLALFELGTQRIPDLSFDITQGSATGSAVVPGREVEGVGTLPSNVDQTGASMRDLKELEEVPIRSWRLLYVLGGLLAAAALGYALYRWLKRPRPEAKAQAKPLLPLHTRTLQALDALRSEDLPAQGKGREFHFRLSEIVRGYLGERYGFEALECTSHELLASLRRLHTPGLSMEELTRYAHASDFVKFARAPAEVEECKQSLEFAYRLVQQTRLNADDVRLP